jgi:protein TonB
MTPKKTKRTNLENKRTLFFEYGAVLVLAFLLAAFETGKPLYSETVLLPKDDGSIIDEILIDVTRSEKSLPKPPVVPFELIIVEDPAIIIDEPELPDVEKTPTGPYKPWIFQKGEESAVPDSFFIVEEMPKYRGGTVENFKKHVQELVEYPQDAINIGIDGTVYLQFTVNEKGVLTNPTIVRSPDNMLSNSVLQAVRQTEKWTPGKQRKIPVKVSFTIPVKFTLKEKQ